jgi:hypothetical protein
MKNVLMMFAIMMVVMISGCDFQPTSDETQQLQQEKILQQGNSVGMPAITNFREKRLLKDILELRDQKGLVTYTYVQDEYTGKFRLLGQTIGYGIPYATQYTNPQKYQSEYQGCCVLPQADPNGLFSPASAEGTWVMMQDPNNPDKVLPLYIEQRILVSPFPLKSSIIEQ